MSAARKNKRSQRLLNRLFRVSRTSSASCRLHSNCHDEWAGDNPDVCSEYDADGAVVVVAVVVVVVAVVVVVVAAVVVVVVVAADAVVTVVALWSIFAF